jgi:hypothetical protein
MGTLALADLLEAAEDEDDEEGEHEEEEGDFEELGLA